MIQFEEMPSEEILERLADQNIKILQIVSQNTVMAYIPSDQTIDFEKSQIRWLGKLKPADKRSRHLYKSMEKGYVLVDVFPESTKGVRYLLLLDKANFI